MHGRNQYFIKAAVEVEPQHGVGAVLTKLAETKAELGRATKQLKTAAKGMGKDKKVDRMPPGLHDKTSKIACGGRICFGSGHHMAETRTQSTSRSL